MTALEDEIKRLNSLITNFLDYGKATKLTLEPITLSNLLDDLLILMGNKLAEQHIKLEINCDRDIEFIGDREKLSGCFLNIFLNSIEAIKENGKITLNVVKSDNNLLISIKDSGFGIPDGIKDKIFEPYFSSKTTGIGLGLSFTKKIILEHGLNIWLNSSSEKETEFCITPPTNL